LNRIVIIGNGFDLAHGLPTSYSDFMKFLKNDIFKTGNKISDRDSNELIIRKTNEEGNVDPWLSLKYISGQDIPTEKGFYRNLTPKDIEAYSFSIPACMAKKSIFFRSLFKERKRLNRWSSFEQLYFENLVKHKNNLESINMINKEFYHIRVLFEQYLNEEVEKKEIDFDKLKLDELFIDLKSKSKNDFEFDKTYFLTFNYTSNLLLNYIKHIRQSSNKNTIDEPIFIHGKLGDDDNPIIFGYGDNTTIEYSNLSELDNNATVHFKTINYPIQDEYSRLLEIFDSNTEFYIQLIGHSLEKTDKSLLNWIVSHPKTRKIEISSRELTTKETNNKSEEDRYRNKYQNLDWIYGNSSELSLRIISFKKSFKIPLRKTIE